MVFFKNQVIEEVLYLKRQSITNCPIPKTVSESLSLFEAMLGMS